MKTAIVAIALAAILSGKPAIAQDSQTYRVRLGWALVDSVREENGKLYGAWVGSACSDSQGVVSAIETSLLVRLTEWGTCNGREAYFIMQRPQPVAVPDGACAFDYVTVGGMISGIFQEVAEHAMPPASMAQFRQALPNLRRVFATQQGGGLIALVGWSDRPIANSVENARRNILTDVERSRGSRSGSHKTLPGQPWAIADTHDYQDSGKPRRDVTLLTVANRGCLFSAKFSGVRQAGGEQVWASLEGEVQRIQRVIGNYEAGKPWALSGIK